ncbi:hypothetical protein KC980_01505, partial [candidate division WWE3 bacterium]|nr:hypothetical protein [candidate division WWE3 bacterium]
LSAFEGSDIGLADFLETASGVSNFSDAELAQLYAFAEEARSEISSDITSYVQKYKEASADVASDEVVVRMYEHSLENYRNTHAGYVELSALLQEKLASSTPNAWEKPLVSSSDDVRSWFNTVLSQEDVPMLNMHAEPIYDESTGWLGSTRKTIQRPTYALSTNTYYVNANGVVKRVTVVTENLFVPALNAAEGVAQPQVNRLRVKQYDASQTPLTAKEVYMAQARLDAAVSLSDALASSDFYSKLSTSQQEQLTRLSSERAKFYYLVPYKDESGNWGFVVKDDLHIGYLRKDLDRSAASFAHAGLTYTQSDYEHDLAAQTEDKTLKLLQENLRVLETTSVSAEGVVEMRAFLHRQLRAARNNPQLSAEALLRIEQSCAAYDEHLLRISHKLGRPQTLAYAAYSRLHKQIEMGLVSGVTMSDLADLNEVAINALDQVTETELAITQLEFAQARRSTTQLELEATDGVVDTAHLSEIDISQAIELHAQLYALQNNVSIEEARRLINDVLSEYYGLVGGIDNLNKEELQLVMYALDVISPNYSARRLQHVMSQLTEHETPQNYEILDFGSINWEEFMSSYLSNHPELGDLNDTARYELLASLQESYMNGSLDLETVLLANSFSLTNSYTSTDTRATTIPPASGEHLATGESNVETIKSYLSDLVKHSETVSFTYFRDQRLGGYSAHAHHNLESSNAMDLYYLATAYLDESIHSQFATGVAECKIIPSTAIDRNKYPFVRSNQDLVCIALPCTHVDRSLRKGYRFYYVSMPSSHIAKFLDLTSAIADSKDSYASFSKAVVDAFGDDLSTGETDENAPKTSTLANITQLKIGTSPRV